MRAGREIKGGGGQGWFTRALPYARVKFTFLLCLLCFPLFPPHNIPHIGLSMLCWQVPRGGLLLGCQGDLLMYCWARKGVKSCWSDQGTMHHLLISSDSILLLSLVSWNKCTYSTDQICVEYTHKLYKHICTQSCAYIYIYTCVYTHNFIHAHVMCLSYLMPKESFVLHCCVKERTFVSEEVTNRERKTYILEKAIMLHTHSHTSHQIN